MSILVRTTESENKATRMYKYEVLKFRPLGKEIKISPKANISINKAGFKTEFYVDTICLTIGIGNDHTADLIMTKDAWEALKNGEKINIETTKSFKKKFL